MTGMSDVFISHAQSTTALTRRIADTLRSLGHTVWWDDELLAHQEFRKVIQERLNAAKAVVVIWANDAVESTWVPSEAEFGRAKRILVQISVEGTVPPLPFEQIQFADMTGWSGDGNAPGWRKVIASVDELVSGARPTTVVQSASAALPAPSATRRGRIVAAVLALLIGIGGASIWHLMTRAPQSPTTVHDATDGGSIDDGAANTDNGFMNRPAIAVLPFENLSDDPKQAIFADGLAEELITRLSGWRAFPVIGRVSSFHYRGDVDIKRVAKD